MEKETYYSRRYNVTSLINIVESEDTPEHIAECIESVMYSYIDDRFNNGDTGSCIASNVYALRLLLEAFKDVCPKK